MFITEVNKNKQHSTHVIKPVFINIPKHSDNITSTEGQLSLSEDRDTNRKSSFVTLVTLCFYCNVLFLIKS